MSRHEQWFREAWVEKVPAPLDMSDTEIVEWLSEHCDSAWLINGEWHVSPGDCPAVSKPYFRDAVKLAAAYHREINA